MQLFGQGANASVIAQVEAQQLAVRTSIRPQDTLNWTTIAVKSGLLATPAASANLFSFRNSGVNNVIVRRLGVGAVVGAAVTLSQLVDFAAYVARGFTAADTGGTAIVVNAGAGRHRTSFASLSFGATAGTALIASTTAIVSGTRTLDANAIGLGAASSGTAAGTVVISPSKTNLILHDAGDHPILLAPSEGLVIQNLTALASGSLFVYVDMELAEVATTAF